uniref:Uncharacterized protein n=2 Tax=unclassified Caudoviricetes TaxID=2788787 RepID=A0A8S5QFS0_9CAUD|nr:MAG TPA: hypothetical protein [Siphoviridae sp. ctMkg9]DAE17928.1 MAG TPA: hypothetical protein [Siphoviridae sp. ctRBF36]
MFSSRCSYALVDDLHIVEFFILFVVYRHRGQ